MTHWLTGAFSSYRRAIVFFAISIPVCSLTVELARVLAAWYTGGWERNATSAGIGAVVGIALCPLAALLIAALSKALALVLPSATTSRPPDSGSPG
jgi:hypothetical protein